MSNQDLERESFFEDQSGKKKHRDQYGVWYIKDNGWENLYFNSIMDTNLKEMAEAVYDNNDGGQNTQFEHEGMKLTMWFNESKEKATLSRRLSLAKNTQTLDTMDTDPKQGAGGNLGSIPESIKKIMDETAKQNTSSGGKKFTGPSGYFKSSTYQFGTLEEFKSAVEKDSNVRALTPKEMNPTNYLISNGSGHAEISLWWGVWVKYQPTT
jgi:hypothetical protein